MANRDPQNISKPDYLILFELLDYVPVEVVAELVKILRYGAKKHGPTSYIDSPYPKEEVMKSTLRHFVEVRKSNPIDEESGEFHSSCLTANAMVLLAGDVYGWWDKEVQEQQEEITKAGHAPVDAETVYKYLQQKRAEQQAKPVTLEPVFASAPKKQTTLTTQPVNPPPKRDTQAVVNPVKEQLQQFVDDEQEVDFSPEDILDALMGDE